MRILILILLFFPLVGFSQEISKSEKTKVVNRLIDALENRYVLIDTSKLMVEKLQSNLNRGAYDSITDHSIFASTLTNDLKSVYDDKHMGVFYLKEAKKNKKKFFEELDGTDKYTAKILDNNTGYISFNTFLFHDPKARKVNKEVISRTKDANYLIIDVRGNYGGNANMIIDLTGYFIEPETPVAQAYKRSGYELKAGRLYKTFKNDKGLRNVDRPVFVLIDEETASAAEAIAYHLQSFGRATVVGDVSLGAAHANRKKRLSKDFVMMLPYEKLINTVTKTDYEGVGVIPDVEIKASKALDRVLNEINSMASVGKTED